MPETCWVKYNIFPVNMELINKAARCLAESKYAIALTGAGISTESGIQDFRGPDGLWTRNPEMEKLAYEMYYTFLRDPAAYWQTRLTKPYMLGDMSIYKPNPGHYALADMENQNVLKCVITQNIDGLHEMAGTRRLIEYHGSINKLRCSVCGRKFARSDFDIDTMLKNNSLPPRCPVCKGAVKDDVVHFNEPIPVDVSEDSLQEAGSCDVMLICGTSAVVYPFASLPRVARQRGGPQVTIIEVNAEPTPLTGYISDFLIQGKTATILPQIAETIKKLINPV
jgi:NAD-dependent deacetylase